MVTLMLRSGATVSQNATLRHVEASLSHAKVELLEVKLEAAERERNEAVRREQEEKERHRETRENRDRLLSVIEEQSKTIAALPAASAVSTEIPSPNSLPKRGLWARIFGGNPR